MLEYALAELVTTERSYVNRLEALYNVSILLELTQRYALPLQQLSLIHI